MSVFSWVIIPERKIEREWRWMGEQVKRGQKRMESMKENRGGGREMGKIEGWK